MATETRAKSNKKRYLKSAVVVSDTNCSTVRSLYLSCRHHLRHSKFSKKFSSSSSSSTKTPCYYYTSMDATQYCLTDGEEQEAVKAYWRRAHDLEQEIDQLEKWINIEKSLAACIKNITRTNMGDHHDYIRPDHELIRLGDGGYLYHIKMVQRTWGRLAIQFSAPAILQAESSPEISQVLQRMGSMGTRNLSKWLLQSMQMGDIHKNRDKEKEMGTVHKGNERGFMEAIVLASMEKMEILAIEGLRTQMGTRKVKQNEEFTEETEKKTGKGSIFLVMLMQMRDAEKEYESVGSVMIGLVKASVGEEERSEFHINEVHVAGISADFKDAISLNDDDDSDNTNNKRRDLENYLWSLSVKYCDGRKCNFGCWDFARNPDIEIVY